MYKGSFLLCLQDEQSPMSSLATNLEDLFTDCVQCQLCKETVSKLAEVYDESSKDSGIDMNDGYSPSLPTSFKGLFTAEIKQQDKKTPITPKLRRTLFAEDCGSPVLSTSYSTSTESPVQMHGHYSMRKHRRDAKIQGLKRKLSDTEIIESPSGKKVKMDFSRVQENIISAMDKKEAESSLVGDCSRSHSLPTIPGKQQDLKYITPETMADVLTGRIQLSDNSDYQVIDCRYPYEFEGGHIPGALNLHTQEKLCDFVKKYHEASDKKDTLLIFHCEFSSERGPKRARFLRNFDRQVNADNYPHLNFPEIYIMAGGYKDFFMQFPEECSPEGYTPMLHKDHKSDLKKFRSKSKSWTAGDRASPRMNRSRFPGLRLEY